MKAIPAVAPLAFSINAAVEAANGAAPRTAIYAAVKRQELTLHKRGKRSFLMADEFLAWLRGHPTTQARTAA